MKVVKYVAEGNCKVKVGGIEYGGNKVIPVGGDKGLSEEDITRLLQDRFIRKVELEEDDNDTASTKKNGKKSAEEKKVLIEKATGLGITVTQEMTAEVLQQLITEAEAQKK